MPAISLALGETKSNISLSNESKDAGLTWDEATWTWDEESSTWDLPKLNLSRESKNNISLSNEPK
jgi:hypothetical protein